MHTPSSVLEQAWREVQKSRKLSHPHIIRIHDLVRTPGEDPFITMEFVEGRDLSTMRLGQDDGVFRWEQIRL